MKLNSKSLLLSVSLLTMSYTSFAGTVIAPLPELVTQAKVGAKTFDPQNDKEWVSQSLNLDLDIRKFGCKIIAYRIQAPDKTWSSWFAPGINDLGKKDTEQTRRAWAAFTDHRFQIIYSSYGPTSFDPVEDNPNALNPNLTEQGTLPELSNQAHVISRTLLPRADLDWVNESLNRNLDEKKFGCRIIAYQVQWFDGTWSGYYVPGINDLYKKQGEPLRAQWALFNDHKFHVLYTGTLTTN